MGEQGLMGMPFPDEFGGAGLDYHSYAIALEEISHGSGGPGTVVAHTCLAGTTLYESATAASGTPVRRSTGADSFDCTGTEPPV